MFYKFSKLDKSIALLLDVVIYFIIAILLAVVITMWIAKRYNAKRFESKMEERYKILKESVGWLKMLIEKECEEVNYLTYILKKQDRKILPFSINLSYITAIELLLKNIEEIKVTLLKCNNFSLYIQSEEISSFIFESHFCKFGLGYYQKFLDSVEKIQQNDSSMLLFSNTETESLGKIITVLQQLLKIKAEKIKESIVIKGEFWQTLHEFIEFFALEEYFESGLTVRVYKKD